MNKLKVLHIIPNFGIGGAEKLVIDYLIYSDNNDVDARAISLYENCNTHYDQAIKSRHLSVYYFDKKPGLDVSMIKKINVVINEFQPDIVHSHLYCMKYVLPSILTLKNIRIFHTIHNEPQKDASGIDRFANMLAFKLFKATPITLTEDLKEKTNAYYNIKNSAVINNGICLNRFKDVDIGNKEAKERLGISLDTFVIGHVGRFSMQKNHTFIIDIFEYILREKKAMLLLIGDGELRNDIEKKATELGVISRIKFLGMREDIPQIMRAMDVFLFPSLYEGFPITLIEAQAAGVKCVISSTIDKNSVLSSNTFMVNLEDPIEHWNEIILNSELKNSKFGELDNYDIYKSIEKLVDLYKTTK